MPIRKKSGFKRTLSFCGARGSASILLFSLLLPLFFITGCKKKPTPPPVTFPVQIGKSIERPAPLYIEALGHVEPIISVEVRSRIEGELMKVYFTEGQEVKKNDLLFTIDPRPYEAALKNAKAVLDQSLANLTLAQEKVKRYAQLTRDDYYSQIDYETIQTNYASTAALVQQNQASVDSAALNLEYCWIYAPNNGLTGILQIDQGNLISVGGQPLVTVNQMAPIYVTFSIPEYRLSSVRQAHAHNPLAVLVAFEDFKKEKIQGTLQMFDNTVDTATGMINLRGVFTNEDRVLWPGQFVRSRLILDTLAKAVLIPTTAIQQTQKGPIVYVVKADYTVEIRSLKLGQREDDLIIVLDGLKANESIVIEGQINLFQGAKVYVPGAAS